MSIDVLKNSGSKLSNKKHHCFTNVLLSNHSIIESSDYWNRFWRSLELYCGVYLRPSPSWVMQDDLSLVAMTPEEKTSYATAAASAMWSSTATRKNNLNAFLKLFLFSDIVSHYSWLHYRTITNDFMKQSLANGTFKSDHN